MRGQGNLGMSVPPPSVTAKTTAQGACPGMRAPTMCAPKGPSQRGKSYSEAMPHLAQLMPLGCAIHEYFHLTEKKY